jgi:hypothetical protein
MKGKTMTEPKRNPNPFIRMAQEAAKAKGEHIHQDDQPHKVQQKQTFKPTRGNGGASVQRRAARGG